MKIRDVLKTIDKNDQKLVLDRQEEITALCEGIYIVSTTLDDAPNVINSIRCALEAAYVMGRRDGVNVPESFKF